MFVLTKEDEVRLATGTYHACFDRANKPDGIYIWGCHLGHGNQEWKWDKETGERARLDNAAHAMLCHACAMLCYAIRLRTLRRTLSLVRSTRQPVTSCRVVTLTDCCRPAMAMMAMMAMTSLRVQDIFTTRIRTSAPR